MAQNLYQKTERFVKETFKDSWDKTAIKHMLRTVYWVKVLRPDANEALLIAAVSHDIERGFRSKDLLSKFDKSEKGFIDEDYLTIHQNESARIICEFPGRL